MNYKTFATDERESEAAKSLPIYRITDSSLFYLVAVGGRAVRTLWERIVCACIDTVVVRISPQPEPFFPLPTPLYSFSKRI